MTFLNQNNAIIKADSTLDRDLCTTSNSRFLMTFYENESAKTSSDATCGWVGRDLFMEDWNLSSAYIFFKYKLQQRI